MGILFFSGVLLLSIFHLCDSSVHVNLSFPFSIETIDKKYEGRMCSNTALRSLIPLEVRDEETGKPVGGCSTETERYLQIIVKSTPGRVKGRQVTSQHPPPPRKLTPLFGNQGPGPRQGLSDQHKQINKSGRITTEETSQVPVTPISIDEARSLPVDIVFDVIHTKVFDIDDKFFLVVSDTESIKDTSEVQFYVVLFNTTSEEIVSNPLPFIIHIDQPEGEGRPHGAAVFAGVICLLVILIVLIIPITVCVKRRRKAGKPICWGENKSEKENGEVGTNQLSGQINDSMIFDDGTMLNNLGSDESPDPKGTTIQDHMLRSVSRIHFQPKWLDPHYRHVHVHPNYHSNQNHGANNGQNTQL